MPVVDVEHPWTSIGPVVDRITALAIHDLDIEAANIPDITDNPYEQKDMLRQLVRETIELDPKFWVVEYGPALNDCDSAPTGTADKPRLPARAATRAHTTRTAEGTSPST